MDQSKASRPRPESAVPMTRFDLEGDESAHPSDHNHNLPTSLGRHHHLRGRTPAQSAYHNLRARISALFVWMALSLRKAAVEPTLLAVLTNGCLVFLFWFIAFSTDDLTDEPELWLVRSWASVCFFELMFGIYVFQSFCRRLIRKIRTGDPVPLLTLWVCASQVFSLVVTRTNAANRGMNSFNLCWLRRHGPTSLYLPLFTSFRS